MADDGVTQGRIVVLNGAPRSGKTSIAHAVQSTFDEPWVNLGVDHSIRSIPERLWPGIGLRPGGERPDLEPLVEQLYLALYDSAAAHARLGLDVIMDVGHHESYANPMRILPKVALRVGDLPVLFVGVRCPIDVIMSRRVAAASEGSGGYLIAEADGQVPAPVLLWQRAVHEPGIYDLEVDTSMAAPEACADLIRRRLETKPPTPTAFERLAALSD